MPKKIVDITPTPFVEVMRMDKEDRSSRHTIVELVVAQVNAVMANAKDRSAARCSPEIGRYWQVRIDILMRPKDVLLVQQMFEDAGWPAVQVVYWNKRVSVTLYEARPTVLRGPVYNGQPARQADPEAAPEMQAA
jgi:hypothetical protein